MLYNFISAYFSYANVKVLIDMDIIMLQYIMVFYVGFFGLEWYDKMAL